MVLMNETKKVWSTPTLIKTDMKTVTLGGGIGEDDGEGYAAS